jgi:amino acid adenylation domain-containing protein
LLGVLKAGCGYVPVDPEYPEERKQYMIADTGSALVITGDWLAGSAEAIGQCPAGKVEGGAGPGDLAYVIYTSGSTGRPKGVMIGHRNLSSFLRWCRSEFADSGVSTVYAGTSVCFDLSVFEIYYPLVTGLRVRIVSSGLSIGGHLSEDRDILLNTVPGVMEVLLQSGVDLSQVRAVNLAGEPISGELQRRLPHGRITWRNLYGPTEDTTYSTVYRIEAGAAIRLGRSITGKRIYILDRDGGLCGIGMAGEIAIGGWGVARGYLGQAELTGQRFVADPFDGRPGERIYRTGDLARWLPDGNIEYLGRMDDQVKVRGYRVEPGEVERAMSDSGLVTGGVVALRKGLLVGYVVPRAEYDRQQLLSYLRDRLPGYMVPSAVVELDRLPLTLTGKLDRRSLPDPGSSLLQGGEYVAPRDSTETKLVEIWQESLGLQQVGIYDNFFELGGHSLLATTTISAICKALSVNIPLKVFFQLPNIEAIARYIKIEQKELPVAGQYRRLTL